MVLSELYKVVNWAIQCALKHTQEATPFIVVTQYL